MKAMIISGVIPFLLGAIASCKDKSKEYQGIYFNIDDHSEYIELKDDGVAFSRHRINPCEYPSSLLVNSSITNVLLVGRRINHVL